MFGRLAFYVLRKKRRVAYRNLKIAFPRYPPQKINKILKQTFMNVAQHVAEVLYMPWIDEKYINKFIEFEGLDSVLAVLVKSSNKKGSIFLALHEGSWEIGSAVTAYLLEKHNYTILSGVQPKFPLLNKLLIEYRTKTVPNITVINQSLRPIIESLNSGHAMGMLIDHGARDGILVDFFGRPALTPTGALKLALKMDTNVFLGFMKHKQGAQHKIMLSSYDLVRTGSDEDDLKLNLENIHRIYERYISESPQEYLWFFKRWKHSPQRNVLVLSDGKAGHLKQSLAVVDLIKDLPFNVKYDVVEVKLENWRQKVMLHLCGFFFSNKCQGCMWCARRLFSTPEREKIMSNYYDAVISCGSGLAMLNRLVAFENMAKSIVIMKPGMFSLKRFDLVIAPEHDNAPKFKNVVSIHGAIPREIDWDKDAIEKVKRDYKLDSQDLPHPVIGLFLGGSNKYLTLDKSRAAQAIDSLNNFIEAKGGCLLVSTSRRTAQEVEALLKEKFSHNPKCKMLIIANESNPRGSYEAILSLSDILIISGDSISMISEAVHSGKHTVVFRLKRKFPYLPSRHERFINRLQHKEYIYAAHAGNISNVVTFIWKHKPLMEKVKDKGIILEKLKAIL
jgi:KDO2-lipid IV(A) lauroyltransferase